MQIIVLSHLNLDMILISGFRDILPLKSGVCADFLGLKIKDGFYGLSGKNRLRRAVELPLQQNFTYLLG